MGDDRLTFISYLGIKEAALRAHHGALRSPRPIHEQFGFMSDFIFALVQECQLEGQERVVVVQFRNWFEATGQDHTLYHLVPTVESK